MTAYYYRQGAAALVAVTLSDLATLNAAFAAGGVKEIGDGLYRVDWPDDVFMAGADWVVLVLYHGTMSVYQELVAIEASGADDLYTRIGANGSGLTAVSLSPDGFDAIDDTEPVAPSSGWNFRQWLRWLVMREVNAARTPDMLTVKTLAGVTSTTQAVSDDGMGNESSGATS